MVIAFVGKIGGTCWVNPSIHPGCIDVVVSAWGWKSDKGRFLGEGERRQAILRDFLIEREVAVFENEEPDILFSGTIRSQVYQKPKRRHVYAAGDTAGMAIPKTGDGFRWAMLGGRVVAKAVDEGRTPKQAYMEFYKKRPLWKDRLLQGATIYRLEKQAKGSLGTSVESIGDILKRHPNLKDLAEDFFIRESLHPRLLLCILANPHFREILIKSILAELKVAVRGIDKIPHYYPFPEME